MSYILGVGEILWDLIGASEYLGGAVLNFCVQSARLGHRVTLVSAVGDDERGRRALAQARALGLSTQFIRTVSVYPTGTVTVAVDSAGQPSYVIHRPAAYDFASLEGAELDPPDWIAFGTLFSMHPNACQLLHNAIERFPHARRFYDVNLRRDSYTPELVASLLKLAHVVKLNDAEARELAGPDVTLEAFCRRYPAACVTFGAGGCALWLNGEFVEVPGYHVAVADTVGAGDAFSAALVHGIQAGWPAREVGDFANRLGALVARRRGGTPAWTFDELEALQSDRMPS
jgi:fructokinase